MGEVLSEGERRFPHDVTVGFAAARAFGAVLIAVVAPFVPPLPGTDPISGRLAVSFIAAAVILASAVWQWRTSASEEKVGLVTVAIDAGAFCALIAAWSGDPRAYPFFIVALPLAESAVFLGRRWAAVVLAVLVSFFLGVGMLAQPASPTVSSLEMTSFRVLLMVIVTVCSTIVAEATARRERAFRDATRSTAAVHDMLERLTLEESAARTLLDSVYSRAPVALGFVDRDLRYVRVNDALASLNGRSAADHVGRSVADVLPDLAPRVVPLLQRVLDSGEPVESMPVELPYPVSGLPGVFDVSFFPVTGFDGLIVGVGTVIDDVTEHHVEAARNARLARQRGVLAVLATDAASATDRDQLFQRTTEALAAALDVPLAKVLELDEEGDLLRLCAGVGWAEGSIGHATVETSTGSQAGYTLTVGEPVVVEDLATETRFAAPDLLLEHSVASGISIAIGGPDRPFGVLGVHSTERRGFDEIDVDLVSEVAAVLGSAVERLRSAAEVRRVEAQFRQIAASIQEIFWMRLAGERRFLYLSDAFEHVFGIPVAHAYADAESWYGSIHGDDRARVREQVGDLAGPYEVEYRIIRPDGEVRWLATRSSLIPSTEDEPARLVGVTEDITTRKLAQGEVVARLGQQQAVADLAMQAVDAQDLGPLFERAVTLVSSMLEAERVEILERRGDHLVQVASVGWPAPVPAELVSAGPSTHAGCALESGAPIVIDDVVAESRFDTSELAAHGITNGISLPIGSAAQPWGALGVHSESRRGFGSDDVVFLEGVAGILSSAVYRARGEDELRLTSENRQRLLDALVTAQEDERGRVARELHDGVGQVLTSLALFAADLEHQIEDDGVRAKIVSFRERVQATIGQTRRLVWSLRPVELDTLGLDAALERLVVEVTADDGPVVDLSAELGDQILAPSVSATVFRVVQEAVTNALRHAQARSVSVVVSTKGSVVSVVVEDDGRGFTPDTEHEGYGLLGMRQRASLAGGSLVIDSREGTGTTVRLEVPTAP